MPIRLILFFAITTVGVLFLAFLNPDEVPVKLYPGFSLNLTPAIIIILSFTLGVFSVFFLYFYDTLAGTLEKWRKSSELGRTEKVAALFVAAKEKLVLGLKKDAAKLYKKALSINPEHTPSLIAVGTIAREEGEIADAITFHSKAKGVDPQSVEALLELASDYVEAEQFANAVTTLNEAKKIAVRSYPLLSRIRDIFIKVENWPESLSAQRNTLDAAPREKFEEEQKIMAALLFETGLEQFNAGDYGAARDRFREAIKSDPTFTPAYLKLAETEELAGWNKDAEKILEKGFKKTRSLIILKFLEAYLVSLGEPERAAAELRWARNLAPEEPLIRLFLAGSALASGDHESAKNEISHINGTLRETTLFHIVEGSVHGAENNTTQAMESLKAAYKTEMASIFHFTCSSCHWTYREYAGRCKQCGSWNTFEPALT